MKHRLVCFLMLFLGLDPQLCQGNPCTFPSSWWGSYFQLGLSQPLIVANTSITGKGECMWKSGNQYVLENEMDSKKCRRCMNITRIHNNVILFKESIVQCETNNSVSFVELCMGITNNSTVYAAIRQDGEAELCPFEGPHTFSYAQEPGMVVCNDPPSYMNTTSNNTQLLFSFQACTDVKKSELSIQNLTCLAGWKDGSKHYLVGELDGQISDEQKYRCYVYEYSRKGSKYSVRMGESPKATCLGLRSPLEEAFRIYNLSKEIFTFDEALKAGDNDAVVKFIELEGPRNLNLYWDAGRVALIHAVNSNFTDVVKTLLKYVHRLDKSEYNLRNISHWSPMMVAAKEGNIELMNILFEHGATATTKALIKAAENGQPEAASLLISKRAPCTKETLLKAAEAPPSLAKGYGEVIKMLVNCGVDVDATYSWRPDVTPLMIAARAGRLDIVKSLVELGAQVGPPTNPSATKTALKYAAWNNKVGSREITHYLLKHGNFTGEQLSESALSALYSGNNHALVPLLEAGAKLNLSSGGRHPLILTAASSGYSEVIQTLINNGADVDTKAKYGDTPLLKAIEGKHLETVRILIKNGANMEGTYLELATRANKTDILRLLLENGANPNHVDILGRTPLFFAAKAGRPDMVTILMDHGANINLQDQHEETALMRLADDQPENVKAVKILLEHGADPNIRSNFLLPKTALSESIKYQYWGVIKALLDHGAKVDKRALEEAAHPMNGDRNILKYLKKHKSEHDEYDSDEDGSDDDDD